MIPRLATAFFATGFAALLCQIVWQRMLGLFAFFYALLQKSA